MRFPYGNKKALGFGNIPTIKLKLKIERPGGFIDLLFLFDTGADVTSLPKSLAKKLGIDLQTCPQETMIGYTGEATRVFLSKISLRLGKGIFSIPCVFSSHEDVPIILGRAGILTRFNIFLNGKDKEIVFEDLLF